MHAVKDTPVNNEQVFWKHTRQGIVPEITGLYKFLNDRNFMCTAIGANDVRLYQRDGIRLRECDVPLLSNTLRHYLQEEFIGEDHGSEVLEAIAKFRLGKLFDKANLFTLLEKAPALKLRHQKESATYYFNNGFARVTAEGVSFQDYKDFEGCIPDARIINRDFSPIDISSEEARKEAPRGYNFLEFLISISSTAARADDGSITYTPNEDKFQYLGKLLGYLLHDYRQRGITDFAVIFCDDEAGRTGKGILLDAVAELTPTCIQDAKRKETTFDPKNLNELTRVRVYNDIQRGFDFKGIYNEISDGASFRHLHKDLVSLSYKDSWKVVLTSNHVIMGTKDSDTARQRVFDATPYFSANYTPRDRFKHLFFSEDWTPADWNFFYNIMLNCVVDWLACDYKLKYQDAGFEQRRLEAQYPGPFRTFVDGLKADYHQTNQIFMDFKLQGAVQADRYLRDMNSTAFGRKLSDYLTDTKRLFTKNASRTIVYIGELPSAQKTVAALPAIEQQPAAEMSKESPDSDLPF